MQKLRGDMKWTEIASSQSEEVLKNLVGEVEMLNSQSSLMEIAKQYGVPLQILLNNLSKKLNIPVQWPEVRGLGDGYRDDFGKSTGLRQGRPPGIGKVVAVHSGKGGVGKTFLAIALARQIQYIGKKCGLLDLDLDCPNILRALAMRSRHITSVNKKITPLNYEGIQVVSMGAIQEKPSQPIMWRGPVLTRAMEQLFYDSEWDDLDYLIVDFPPGTSDIPLTFYNITKPDGVFIITTPQPTALDDASKAINMCRQLKVPVAGVIENMCGEIFGHSDQLKVSQLTGAKCIGKIDLDKRLAGVNLRMEDYPLDLQETLKSMIDLI